MKKILILGSQGMLGSALVRVFGDAHAIVGWDKKDVDITLQEELKKKIFELQPQLIINATGHNGVDITETDAAAYALAQKINGDAVGHLAQISNQLGVPFVHYSTDYVFDGSQNIPYIESATPNPLSKYAQTKLAGEKLLQQNTDHYYLIRLSRLFGKPGPSEGSKKSFVDIVIDLANQGKQKLELVNDEVSSPTLSDDVAIFTRMIIEEQLPYGTYHGANTGATTWYELGKKVAEIKHLPIEIVPVPKEAFPRSAKRPDYSELANTKALLQRRWEAALEAYLLDCQIEQE